MRVELKRRNGWRIPRAKVESHDQVRYGLCHETRIKKVAVLVRGPGDYKCSKCKGPTTCTHEAAVADALSRVTT